jgi:hypothetical protein
LRRRSQFFCRALEEIDEPGFTPAPQHPGDRLQQETNGRTGHQSRRATEPYGGGERVRDRRQTHEREHDKRSDHQYTVDHNRENKLPERKREFPRQPNACDIAADGAQRQRTEEYA